MDYLRLIKRVNIYYIKQKMALVKLIQVLVVHIFLKSFISYLYKSLTFYVGRYIYICVFR